MSFITGQIGKRYEEQIRKLAETTGWEITINSMANNFELNALARQLLARYSVEEFGKISFLPGENSMKVKDVKTSDEVKNLIKADFLEATGITIAL